jgi:hypothetical protein
MISWPPVGRPRPKGANHGRNDGIGSRVIEWVEKDGGESERPVVSPKRGNHPEGPRGEKGTPCHDTVGGKHGGCIETLNRGHETTTDRRTGHGAGIVLSPWRVHDMRSRMPERARTDLHDITPPLSQCLDPIELRRADRWDQESSTNDLFARQCCFHCLAPIRSCPEFPQPPSFLPICPDDPQTAGRDLPRPNPATQCPIPQLVR